MTSPTSRIAIIGAGISGLTTAICLRRLGFSHIHIYDDKPSHQVTNTHAPTGYIIAANGVRVLDKIGIAERLIGSGVNIATVQQTKLTGQRLASYVPSSVVGQYLRNASSRISLSHVAVWSHVLMSALHDCLPDGSITYGKQLSNIHKSYKTNAQTKQTYTLLTCEFNGQHTAQLSDGFGKGESGDVTEYEMQTTKYKKHDYDIVIGCDGIDSYIRRVELEHNRVIPYRTVDNAVYVSGVSTFSELDAYWKQNRSHVTELWGNGVRLIHSYISSTHIYWHLSLNNRYAHIAADKQTALNKILHHVAGNFNQSIRQLIDNTDGTTVQVGHLRDRVPSSRFASDEYNMAVVGSAQHMCTIDTYQSVAQCLESAMALSLSLADNEVKTAFRQYSQVRFPRLNYITNQAFSETSQAVAHSRFMSSIRDWATSLMPPNATQDVNKTMLQYDIAKKFHTRTFG